MTNYILNLEYNGIFAILAYWLPLTLCFFGYLTRTFKNYRSDIRARGDGDHYYYPTDKVGSLIGRAFLTFLPVGNLFAAVFDVAPELFYRFFQSLEKVFNQPLVPRKKNSK